MWSLIFTTLILLSTTLPAGGSDPPQNRMVIVNGSSEGEVRYATEILRYSSLFDRFQRITILSNPFGNKIKRPIARLTKFDPQTLANLEPSMKAPSFENLKLELAASKDDTLTLFSFVDHGGQEPNGTSNISMGTESLDALQLEKFLRDVPPSDSSQRVLLFGTCFGGGMLDFAKYKEEAPPPKNTCGFSESPAGEMSWSHKVKGKVTLDSIREIRDPCVMKSVDKNQDGKVSFWEAHRYSARNYSSRTREMVSSEIYLMSYFDAHRAEIEAENGQGLTRNSLEGPLKRVLGGSSIREDSAIQDICQRSESNGLLRMMATMSTLYAPVWNQKILVPEENFAPRLKEFAEAFSDQKKNGNLSLKTIEREEGNNRKNYSDLMAEQNSSQNEKNKLCRNESLEKLKNKIESAPRGLKKTDYDLIKESYDFVQDDDGWFIDENPTAPQLDRERVWEVIVKEYDKAWDECWSATSSDLEESIDADLKSKSKDLEYWGRQVSAIKQVSALEHMRNTYDTEAAKNYAALLYCESQPFFEVHPSARVEGCKK